MTPLTATKIAAVAAHATETADAFTLQGSAADAGIIASYQHT